MPSLDWLSGSTIDTNAGTITLPYWLAGAAAALLLLLVLLAIYRASFAAVVWTIARLSLVVVVAAAAWAFVSRAAERDRVDERRGLELRMQELAGRSTTPGSALGCVDIAPNDALDAFCERAIFASPESVAAAVAYEAEKLSLLADAVDYAHRQDPSYLTSVAGFRRSLEADRFGVLTQVLVTRHGCTVDRCSQLALLSDATQVNSHLKEGSFDALVARYSPAWPQGSKATTPVAMAPAPSPPPVAAPATSGPNFPSAASIPAVSIMTNEPSAPPASAPAAAPASRRSLATPAAPHQAPPPHDAVRVRRTTAPQAGQPVQLAPTTPAASEPPAPSQ